MDAVVGALQSSKTIYAASKLSYFDRMKNEGQSHSSATKPAVVASSVSALSVYILVFKLIICRNIKTC